MTAQQNIAAPIKKLSDFFNNNKDMQSYFPLAVETFFEGLLEEYETDDVAAIPGFAETGLREFCMPPLTEYFFTNHYEEDGSWNAVNYFLASETGQALTAYEKAWCEALRDSTVRIYEVLEKHEDGASIRIRDADDAVYRVTGDAIIDSWDIGEIVAVRLLHVGDAITLSGTCLQLTPELADFLSEYLKIIRQQTEVVAASQGEIGDEEMERISDILQAVDIFEQFALDVLHEYAEENA